MTSGVLSLDIASTIAFGAGIGGSVTAPGQAAQVEDEMSRAAPNDTEPDAEPDSEVDYGGDTPTSVRSATPDGDHDEIGMTAALSSLQRVLEGDITRQQGSSSSFLGADGEPCNDDGYSTVSVEEKHRLLSSICSNIVESASSGSKV